MFGVVVLVVVDGVDWGIYVCGDEVVIVLGGVGGDVVFVIGEFVLCCFVKVCVYGYIVEIVFEDYIVYVVYGIGVVNGWCIVGYDFDMFYCFYWNGVDIYCLCKIVVGYVVFVE